MISQNKVFFGYIPVISKGMLEMMRSYGSKVDMCLIWGSSFTQLYRSLQKDIRGLDPKDIKTQIDAHYIFKSVEVVETDEIAPFIQNDYSFVMPDEVETRDYANTYLKDSEVLFDNRWRLRWDKTRTLEMVEIVPDLRLSKNDFDRDVISNMKQYAQNSPDWFRQVGACIVRDGVIILSAYNNHMPSEHSSYIEGDPRTNFKAGQSIDSTLSVHAEISLISQAACNGISLKGAILYTTTFPCAWCARAIVLSGITQCFFLEGYSNLDAQQLLKDAGVELILVQ